MAAAHLNYSRNSKAIKQKFKAELFTERVMTALAQNKTKPSVTEKKPRRNIETLTSMVTTVPTCETENSVYGTLDQIPQGVTTQISSSTAMSVAPSASNRRGRCVSSTKNGARLANKSEMMGVSRNTAINFNVSNSMQRQTINFTNMKTDFDEGNDDIIKEESQLQYQTHPKNSAMINNKYKSLSP